MLIDKAQVARQFGRAASSYDSAAGVQQKMSDQLIGLTSAYTGDKTIERITDLGCGTGLSLQELSTLYPGARLTAVDISPGMLAQARTRLQNAEIVCADMEQYSSTSPQDLIFSNASIQWCDLRKVSDRAYRSLNTGGIFALSTFGPDTHNEVAKAWQQVDGRDHRIDFLDSGEHIKILQASGFSMIGHQTSTRRICFDSAQALLDSIKRTGATNASRDRDRGLLSPGRYRNLLRELNREHPLLLSYETLGFIVQK